MPTYLRHLKLQFGGTLGVPAVEIWSCTINFKANTDDSAIVPSVDFSSSQLDAALGLLNAPLQAWVNSTEARLSNLAKLEWAKLNQIEPDGKQRDLNTHRIDTGSVSGRIQSTVPFYQTQVLTFRTNRSRGRGHSGRIFPPAVVVEMGATSPYTSASSATDMATAGATMLNGIADAIQTARGAGDATPVYPVVATPLPTKIGDNTPAMLVRIDRVVVDRVPDVMHSRTRAVARAEGGGSPVTGSTP